MPKPDRSILQAALSGYEAEASRIKVEIAEIRKHLGMSGGGNRFREPFAKIPAPARKHRMSAAGLKHIREAQRKRWAEFHKQQKASV